MELRVLQYFLAVAKILLHLKCFLLLQQRSEERRVGKEC